MRNPSAVGWRRTASTGFARLLKRLESGPRACRRRIRTPARGAREVLRLARRISAGRVRGHHARPARARAVGNDQESTTCGVMPAASRVSCCSNGSGAPSPYQSKTARNGSYLPAFAVDEGERQEQQGLLSCSIAVWRRSPSNESDARARLLRRGAAAEDRQPAAARARVGTLRERAPQPGTAHSRPPRKMRADVYRRIQMGTALPTTHLRRYVLGTAAEEEAAVIEREYFESAEALDRIRAAEDDLIDDYVSGQLPADEHQAFERHYLTTPTHKRRVAVRRALAAAASARSDDRGRLPTWWRTAALAATLVLVVGGAWMRREDRIQRPRPAALPQERRHRRPPTPPRMGTGRIRWRPHARARPAARHPLLSRLLDLSDSGPRRARARRHGRVGDRRRAAAAPGGSVSATREPDESRRAYGGGPRDLRRAPPSTRSRRSWPASTSPAPSFVRTTTSSKLLSAPIPPAATIELRPVLPERAGAVTVRGWVLAAALAGATGFPDRAEHVGAARPSVPRRSRRCAEGQRHRPEAGGPRRRPSLRGGAGGGRFPRDQRVAGSGGRGARGPRPRRGRAPHHQPPEHSPAARTADVRRGGSRHPRRRAEVRRLPPARDGFAAASGATRRCRVQAAGARTAARVAGRSTAGEIVRRAGTRKPVRPSAEHGGPPAGHSVVPGGGGWMAGDQ